jgi:hypothetical protein
MRTHRGKSLVITCCFVGLSAGGCGKDAPRPTQLSLSAAADSRLELHGSLLDRNYVASYSNPRHISAMLVTIQPNGSLRGQCQVAAGATACGDVPFFSRVTTIDLGKQVSVWDLKGQTVAQVLFATSNCTGVESFDPSFTCVPGGAPTPFTPPPFPPDGGADQGASPPTGGTPPPGSTSGGTNGDSNGSGDSGNGTTTGSPSGSTSGSPTGGATSSSGQEGGGGGSLAGCPPAPSDCGALKAWAQACFCTQVNAALVAHQVPTKFDCSVLASGMEFADVDTAYDGPISCGDDLIEPGQEAVVTVVQRCPGLEDLAQNWASAADYTLRSGGYCGQSPLLLDLAGDGLNLSTLEAGTSFDLLGSGHPVKCAWSKGDDAWLVLDLNGNGRVDGAAELFGNESFGRAHPDGFNALAELDSNRDGRIDAADASFPKLLVWTDADRDGHSSPGELTTLSKAGVVAIELQAVRASIWSSGSRIPLVSRFVRANGSTGIIGDAFLQYSPSAP